MPLLLSSSITTVNIIVIIIIIIIIIIVVVVVVVIVVQVTGVVVAAASDVTVYNIIISQSVLEHYYVCLTQDIRDLPWIKTVLAGDAGCLLKVEVNYYKVDVKCGQTRIPGLREGRSSNKQGLVSLFRPFCLVAWTLGGRKCVGVGGTRGWDWPSASAPLPYSRVSTEEGGERWGRGYIVASVVHV